jgi:1,4-dihydroxy-2-naphthoate octaprenyltransferase
MGPIMTGGIVYCVTGHWDKYSLLIGMIPGLMAVLVLHTNNLRDRVYDARVGLWNFAHIEWFARPYWWLIFTGAYVIQGLLVYKQILPEWTLGSLFLLLVLRPNSSVEKIALGHLIFSLLVLVGIYFN